MQSFTVSVGQMCCDRRDIGRNEEKIVRWLDLAAKERSRLLVLPELGLTGYQSFEDLRTEAEKRDCNRSVEGAVERISAKTADAGVDLLLSYPSFSDRGAYIEAAYISRGKKLAVHRKVNLCNYGHYTEHLHFAAGDRVTVALGEEAKFSVVICEDSWHIMNAICATQAGAEILLNPSAASVTDPKDVASCLANWQKMSVGTAFLQTSWFILCNQAGPTPDGIYMGGSHVVDPTGKIVAGPLSVDEALLHVPLDGGLLAETRRRRPLLANERAELYGGYGAGANAKR